MYNIIITIKNNINHIMNNKIYNRLMIKTKTIDKTNKFNTTNNLKKHKFYDTNSNQIKNNSDDINNINDNNIKDNNINDSNNNLGEIKYIYMRDKTIKKIFIFPKATLKETLLKICSEYIPKHKFKKLNLELYDKGHFDEDILNKCCESDNLYVVKYFFDKYNVINKNNNFLSLLFEYNSIKIFKYFIKKYDIKIREIIKFLSVAINDVLFKFIIKKYNIQINDIGLTFLSNYSCNRIMNNNTKMFKYVVNVLNITNYYYIRINYCPHDLLKICFTYNNLNIFKYLMKKYNITLDELMKNTYIINNYYYKCDFAKYLINKFGKCNSDNIFGAKQLFKKYLNFYCYNNSNSDNYCSDNYYYNMLIFLIIKFNLSVKTCMDYLNYIKLMYLSEYRFNKIKKMILTNYATLNYKNINYNSILTQIY